MKKLIFVFCILIISVLLISNVSAFSLRDFTKFFKSFLDKITGKIKTTGVTIQTTPTPETSPTLTPTASPTPTSTPEPSPTESPTPETSPTLTPTASPTLTQTLSGLAGLQPNIYQRLAAVAPEVSFPAIKTEEIALETRKEEEKEKQMVKKIADIREKDTGEKVAEIVQTKIKEIERLDIKFIF